MPQSAPRRWTRLVFDQTPVYVLGDGPDWFVPNPAADRMLQDLIESGDPDRAAWNTAQRGEAPLGAALVRAHALLGQLRDDLAVPYPGRAGARRLDGLREIWFHLTDRCNLSCRHCLFAASPAAGRGIDPGLLRRLVAEARGLGCRLFYFTGGEPFVYPGFIEICGEILGADPEAHVVVLTNGLLAGERAAALARLPAGRLHLQVSVDGAPEHHEALRGRGTFSALEAALSRLTEAGLPVTLAMAVERSNAGDMPRVVEFAATRGISNVHYLWYFARGRGKARNFVPPEALFGHLEAAWAAGRKLGVRIDNVEILRSQVFAPPGSRFDLSNAGWESVAVGPDGHIYPTPALVGIPKLDAGTAAGGLEAAWRRSPVLEALRRASLADDPGLARNPLRFLVGGGDIDHSYVKGGSFVGHDPYLPLYERTVLRLITRAAAAQPPTVEAPAIRLRMGEILAGCRHDPSDVQLTHCNCVVALADETGHEPVRNFYGRAAEAPAEDIRNPVCYPEAEISHIPAAARVRSYGCGSPVMDADPRPGETVVDLGSGSGVECFIAARKVGPRGRVIGVDMTEAMLRLARGAEGAVAGALGYRNVEFREGFLEAVPVADAVADVVISNCVVNLSPDKRRTFAEIARILRPGGRLVFSDVVTDRPAPARLKNDEILRGECLAGAMVLGDLLGLLEALGFTAPVVRKRFFYREVGGFPFFSVTLEARRPADDAGTAEVFYAGPHPGLLLADGTVLRRGERRRIPGALAEAVTGADAGPFYVLDAAGGVANAAMVSTCGCGAGTPAEAASPAGGCCGAGAPAAATGGCCAPSPEPPGPAGAPGPVDEAGPTLATLRLGGVAVAGGEGASIRVAELRHNAGCMVCGAPLAYRPRSAEAACFYCGRTLATSAACERGHFVCDACHGTDAPEVVLGICRHTRETDMVRLLETVRRHPAVPVHGPEHHFIVPAVVTATYRNLGGELDEAAIGTAIARGREVPGGSCGFWGGCGAAIGVGIGFGVILESTPLTPAPRRDLQRVVADVLREIGEREAARCCQRESWIALRKAAELSRGLLPVPLRAEHRLACRQRRLNRECLGEDCPLWTP
ncbi:methyltransferase domain-containing protein [Dissulfurirhabdus thermomarina]|uniref:Methyltransferase domain-containing protein n=2 Tax=Dissulfurirhabdus thermomarina TaxID=1765737 RepID=A0A6N9TU09_DISTH|nr:methyltransferase domain-containing protein [Dissulfurirhabdus thermomarina]NMX24170.1 methyltransferase domain-containing protein [Dissulfurirhabdus thermomarina]